MLSRAVPYEMRVLPGESARGSERRLVLDFSNARLGSGAVQPIGVEDGLLKQIRTGQFTARTARVVIDLASITSHSCVSSTILRASWSTSSVAAERRRRRCDVEGGATPRERRRRSARRLPFRTVIQLTGLLPAVPPGAGGARACPRGGEGERSPARCTPGGGGGRRWAAGTCGRRGSQDRNARGCHGAGRERCGGWRARTCRRVGCAARRAASGACHGAPAPPATQRRRLQAGSGAACTRHALAHRARSGTRR